MGLFPPWGSRTGRDVQWVSSAQAENAHVMAQGASRLFQLQVTNLTGTDLFLQLYDTKQAPSTGSVPVAILPLPANGAAGWRFGAEGRPFELGIAWAVSTTGNTLTKPGVASGFGDGGIITS